MPKVLIVDDKVGNLLALENILTPLGVEIIKASSGEDALRATLNHSFALAILDVQMPGMDGYELAGVLRNDKGTHNLPIIFLSAVYSDEANVFRGYMSGGVEFITKPFNPDILLSKVRVFLELFEQKTELLRQKAHLEALVVQLDEQIEARREAEELLHKTNESLEHTVIARTAELVKMVKALQIANAQLVTQTGQLRALTGRLTMAEHQERQRICKLLHDGLQQQLAIANLQLDVLLRRFEREDLRQAAGKIKTIVTEAIEMSRSLSSDLSPPVLREGGLAAGLEWLVRWMQKTHAFSVELTIEDRPKLSDDVKVLVFESVRELLFNAFKHSTVSSAQVRLQQLDGKGVRITVSDAGAGFDAVRMKPARDYGAGLGLFSIRERIGLIGGSFEISSAPGEGSRFTLTVPHTSAAPAPLEKAVAAAPNVAGDAGAILTA